MAETVSPRISMFPCAANPGPFTPPNQSVQSLPEKVALPPRASTMPSWRTSRPGSSRMTRARASSAALPSAMSRNPSIARYRLGHDWVATAPPPAFAQVTMRPAPTSAVDTATPSWPVRSHRPTIENVERRRIIVSVRSGGLSRNRCRHCCGWRRGAFEFGLAFRGKSLLLALVEVAREQVVQARGDRQADEHREVGATDGLRDRPREEGDAKEWNHRGKRDEVGCQTPPSPAAVRPRRVEDLRDGVAAVADEVEVNEVDRGPWDQEVQQEGQEVAVAAQEVLRQE